MRILIIAVDGKGVCQMTNKEGPTISFQDVENGQARQGRLGFKSFLQFLCFKARVEANGTSTADGSGLPQAGDEADGAAS
jgi:hypothetical protein